MLELHQGTLLVNKSLPVKSLVSLLRLTQVDEGLSTKAKPTTSCTSHLDAVFTASFHEGGVSSPLHKVITTIPLQAKGFDLPASYQESKWSAHQDYTSGSL